MRNLSLISLCIIALSLFAGSCTPGGCFEETTAYVKASMYLTSTMKQVAPDSMSLYGRGMDTLMFYKYQKNIKQAMLPLDPSKGICSLVTNINSVSDTITVWYSAYIHLISKDCGYTYYFSLDSLHTTKNIIDKITITNNSITTLLGENIRIYY